jgi:rhodanese-related sulfurtransferase
LNIKKKLLSLGEFKYAIPMNSRDIKDSIYNELVTVSKAMANPNRLEILDLLAQGSTSVEDVASKSGMTIATASHHLQILKKARLVAIQKEGKYRHYSLLNRQVFSLWKRFREFGISQNAEIRQLLTHARDVYNTPEPVSASELRERVEAGRAVVIDVRPEEEYESGHISDALSIPVDQLLNRIDELPAEKDIIAYCRGPFCTMADEAVSLLLKRGYRATKLDDGYPDWKYGRELNQQTSEYQAEK